MTSTATSTAAPDSTSTLPTTVDSSTTTSVAVAAGWVPLPVDELSGQVAPPCCGANWYGQPSPPLPVPGTTLADGDYFVRTVWPEDPSQPLHVELFRFEQCSSLPAEACGFGESYSDDEMGVDDSESFPLTVPLDEQTRVVLVGFRGFAEDLPTPAAVGSGRDLAELAVAVDQAYATLLAVPFAAGVAPEDILADLTANPRGGFGPGLDGSEYSLSFVHDDAPPLLFQAPFRREGDGPLTAGRGVDGLHVVSVQVVDGRVTLYVFAGFTS